MFFEKTATFFNNFKTKGGRGLMKPLELTGLRFGRLVVIYQESERRDGDVCWLCQCDCGNRRIIRGRNLKKAIQNRADAYKKNL
jgi:hypothetical protein